MPISSVESMTIRIMVRFDTQVEDLLASTMDDKIHYLQHRDAKGKAQ